MTNDFFTTYDVRGKSDDEGTLEVFWNTGKALADWLPTAGDVVVLRAEGAEERFVHAVIEGLSLQGRDVVDGGIGDKVSIKEQVTTAGYSGGVLAGFDTMANVVTMELYKDDGTLIDGEMGLPALSELVEAGNFVPSAVKGTVRTV